MVKFFHEAPNSIFKDVQQVTDGDYFLVHLLEENPTYLAHAKQAVAEGREVILDNSIFELGTAFDASRYAYWINELKPTWYIVPDVLEDCSGTLDSFVDFKKTYADELPGKVIAVAQGHTLSDMLRCFDYLHEDPYVDMVAISFDLSFYEDIYRRITTNLNLAWFPDLNPKLTSWVVGRAYVLDLLSVGYAAGLYTKPIHLLGCALPQEGTVYDEFYQSFIYSTDTSNPVVAGYEGTRYILNLGLNDKSATKLFKIIDEVVSDQQLEDILYNIKSFKELWNVSLGEDITE